MSVLHANIQCAKWHFDAYINELLDPVSGSYIIKRAVSQDSNHDQAL
jgi:hypothetical protein